MFELLLMAQVATSDYVCYADMGSGIINLSHLCGVSGGSSASTGVSLPVEALEPITTESDPVPFARYGRLPGIDDCIDRLGDEIVRDPNRIYGPTTYDELEVQCTDSEVRFADAFGTPRGQIEIVRADDEIWVRVPFEDPTYGWGPFSNNTDARTFATAKQQEYR